MIKRLFVALLFLVSFFSYAQEGSSSPYSFYGLGEERFKGTAENRAMGSINVLPDSIHINFQNPAFYPSLKLTTFSVGGTYTNTRLRTSSEEEKARRTTLDYLAVAFPMGKFGAGFGLVPYTSVGYKLQNVTPVEGAELGRRYTGTGGLNKVFLGAGYQLTKNFSIGAEFSYFFGDIKTSSLYTNSTVQYSSRELNQSSGSGASMNTGLAYTGKINDKLTLFSSVAFSPHTTVSFSNQRHIAVVQLAGNGSVIIVDEEEVPVASTRVAIPAKFTFGFGLGQTRKWMVAADLTTMHNSSMDNRFADIDDATFENGYKVSLGGYYIPKYNSFSSYLNKVTYRAGLRFEKTGLVINDESITDAAVTFGLGAPLGGALSNLNVGFEFGKQGTTNAGLIQQNYASLTVGLSLNDRWFVRRKYD